MQIHPLTLCTSLFFFLIIRRQVEMAVSEDEEVAELMSASRKETSHSTTGKDGTSATKLDDGSHPTPSQAGSGRQGESRGASARHSRGQDGGDADGIESQPQTPRGYASGPTRPASAVRPGLAFVEHASVTPHKTPSQASPNYFLNVVPGPTEAAVPRAKAPLPLPYASKLQLPPRRSPYSTSGNPRQRSVRRTGLAEIDSGGETDNDMPTLDEEEQRDQSPRRTTATHSSDGPAPKTKRAEPAAVETDSQSASGAGAHGPGAAADGNDTMPTAEASKDDVPSPDSLAAATRVRCVCLVGAYTFLLCAAADTGLAHVSIFLCLIRSSSSSALFYNCYQTVHLGLATSWQQVIAVLCNWQPASFISTVVLGPTLLLRI